MNYYGRRRYRRSYPLRSRSRYSRYSTRSTRRATGNQRAARQQRDTSEVNLNIPTQFIAFNSTITLEPGEIDEKTIHAGTFALNVWDLLRRSEFYQSYANMYDQVKINKATIKLVPYQYPIITNAATQNNSIDTGHNYYNSYTIVTAWDRTGLSEEQLQWINYEKDNQNLVIGSADDQDGLYVNIPGSDVATYSSSMTKNVNPNSNTSITRSIYPSAISEKSYYVNTADLKKWYNTYDQTWGRYFGIANPTGVKGNTELVTDFPPGDPVSSINVPQYPLDTVMSAALAKNPCFLQESPNVPFKPTLLVSMYNDPIDVKLNGGEAGTYHFVPRMTFNVEADVVVTFRGLRKAPIVK